MRRTQLMNMLAVVLISGCASNPNPTLRGAEVRLQYAEIRSVERVKMPSAAPAGAIVGGFTGLMLSQRSRGSRQIASGLGGAALGGLAVRALEGENFGYSYNLRYLDGRESKFITEKGYLQKGDCVVVESGTHQNLRRVARTVCESTPGIRAPIALHEFGANECQDAKRQLLLAQGHDQVKLAASKVEVLCQFQPKALTVQLCSAYLTRCLLSRYAQLR